MFVCCVRVCVFALMGFKKKLKTGAKIQRGFLVPEMAEGRGCNKDSLETILLQSSLGYPKHSPP